MRPHFYGSEQWALTNQKFQWIDLTELRFQNVYGLIADYTKDDRIISLNLLYYHLWNRKSRYGTRRMGISIDQYIGSRLISYN
jgi:hypothetical protein